MCEIRLSDVIPEHSSTKSLHQSSWLQIRERVLSVLAHDIQGTLTPLDGYLELLLSKDASFSEEQIKQKQSYIFENMLLATRQLTVYGDYLSLVSQPPLQRGVSELNACLHNLSERLNPFFAERQVSLSLEMPITLWAPLEALPLSVLFRVLILRVLTQAEPKSEMLVILKKMPATRLQRHLQFDIQTNQLWASFVHTEDLDDADHFIQCRIHARGSVLDIDHWQSLKRPLNGHLSPYLQQTYQELDLGLLHQLLSDFKLVLYIESHQGVGSILDLFIPYGETAGRI